LVLRPLEVEVEAALGLRIGPRLAVDLDAQGVEPRRAATWLD
jgi:hypothetical protein